MWSATPCYKVDQLQYPVFAVYSIYVVAGALLIDRLARRIFPGLPLYIVLLSILVFALANPTPYLVATPGIYEAAIGGAQAFLLVGLDFAFDALTGRLEGEPIFQPLSDLNARFTLGWSTGMGALRERALGRFERTDPG